MGDYKVHRFMKFDANSQRQFVLCLRLPATVAFTVKKKICIAAQTTAKFSSKLQ